LKRQSPEPPSKSPVNIQAQTRFDQMPEPTPHDLTTSGEADDQSMSSEIFDWAETFVKHLQIEFHILAGETEDVASVDQNRRWMVIAFLRTLIESGISPQEVERLYLFQAAAMEQNALEPWSEVKNSRRIELIDKSLQDQITSEESKELAQLTNQLREAVDNEQLVPMERAMQLHKSLLDLVAKRREQE